jgi:hypothetical protein
MKLDSNFVQGIILVILGVALSVVSTVLKLGDYQATAGLIIGYGVRHLSGDNGNGVTTTSH